MKNAVRYILLACVAVAIILPLIPLVLTSFSFFWIYPDLMPDWTLRAWEKAFSQSYLVDAIYYSVLIAVIVTLISFVLGFTAAKAIGTRQFRYKTLLEIFFMLPILFPTLSLCMGIQLMFLRTPFYGTLTGMILGQIIFALPYTIFLLSSVFKSYDIEYEQQAYSLGASKLDVLFYVTIPAMKNGLMVALMYTFTVSWSQYLVIAMIGDPLIKTLPVILFSLIGGSNEALASALSIIFILPAMILLIISSYIFAHDKWSKEKIR